MEKIDKSGALGTCSLYCVRLLGIGLPSYVEKRPKIWEAHVSFNLVEKGL